MINSFKLMNFGRSTANGMDYLSCTNAHTLFP